MQKQSARIKCKFKPCKRRYALGQNNNTFTSIRRKKVQSRVKQFKKLFSLVCYFFALNKPSSALNYLKKIAFILTNQN